MAQPQYASDSPRARVRRSVLALMGVTRMSQTELGRVIGASQSVASRRLSGEPFGEDELEAIAERFQCEVPDLYHPETILSHLGYKPDAAGESHLFTLIDGTGCGQRKSHANRPILSVVAESDD